MNKKFLLTFSALVPLVFASNANAQDNDSSQLQEMLSTIEKREKLIEDHEARLKEQKNEIEALRKQLEAFIKDQEKQNKAQAAAVKKVEEVAKQEPQPTETKKTPSSNEVKQVGLERRPIPKEQPPKVAAVPKEGGVLLPPGHMVIEPSFEYTRSSALRVAIEGFTIIPALSIGSFEITEVDRDTLTAAVSARLGIIDDFEISARVPYVYRSDTTATRPLGTSSTAATLSDVDGNDLGDIEVSGHYQINKGQNGWPFLIGNMRFKSRTGRDPFEVALDSSTGLPRELSTGSGFYALQPSITAIYPSDPAVIYGTLGYTYNMKRDIGGTFGEIDPGDSINYGFGVGFAINEDTSFSLSYSHDVVFQTQQNGATIPTSDVLQVVQLTSGVSHRLSDDVNVNLNISAGLTEDAPDMRAGIKVPIKFQAW
jgi:hypothetical protein